MSAPTVIDYFCGEGGAGMGWHRAGWNVIGVDNDPARLARYPFECYEADVVEFALAHHGDFDASHWSPTCTGYSAGTRALPGRLDRYDRLIGVSRELARRTGKPYLIENVTGARSELRDPVMLCGRQFGLAATDDDGTPLVMDRHRLFESNLFLMAPPHPKHDTSLQVAGSYGGARRDKDEARHIRKGGYVPKSVDVQRQLLGTPWMTEKGCQLSIPPAYTEYLGAQFLDQLAVAA